MTLINPMAAATNLPPAAATINLRESRDQSLRNEQVVRATVAKGGLEKVLLQLGQRQFWVQTDTPLATGRKLSLQVVESDEGLQLHLLHPSLTDRVRGALHLAGQSLDLLPLLEDLLRPDQPLAAFMTPASQSALQAALLFFSAQAETTEGRYLKSLLRVLGLDLEKRLTGEPGAEVLASLKGACLEILNRVADESHPLADRLRRLVQKLEANQVFQVRLAEDGMFFLPLPLPFLEFGFLVVEGHTRETRRQENGIGMVTLYLQLSRLGAVTVSLLFEPTGISLRIGCENTQAMDHLASQGEELKELLRPFGLAKLSFTSDAVAARQRLVDLLHGEARTVLDARV